MKRQEHYLWMGNLQQITRFFVWNYRRIDRVSLSPVMAGINKIV